MKKIKLFIAVVFIFLGMYSLTVAQIPNNCPPGFMMQTYIIPVTENGITCDYQIFLCIKCQVGTYPGSIITEIVTHAMRPMDENCQCSPIAVTDAIMNIIQDPNWLYVFINNCGNGWPPCDNTPPVEVKYSYPKCWKWDYCVINDDPIEYVVVKAAGCDCFCSWSKFFCWSNGQLRELIELRTPLVTYCTECYDTITCWPEPCPTIE